MKHLIMQPSPLPFVGSLERKVVDIMALTGDVVDNVPGVPGIGKKTAAALINRWGTLDAVLLSAITGWTDHIMRPRIAALLVTHYRQALMCRELVRLYDRVPIRPLENAANALAVSP